VAETNPDLAYADERLLDHLFNGWGYNFYRAENQLRADDLMVRAKVGEILGAARAAVASAEAAFRRLHLPPPSRERPRQDSQSLAQARALEAMAAKLGALEGQIRALPVPEADRMTQRLRSERETLERLLAADRTMVGAAQSLGRWAGGDAADLLAREAEFERKVAALQAALQDRRGLLQAPA
jgi:hypothetical protein